MKRFELIISIFLIACAVIVLAGCFAMLIWNPSNWLASIVLALCAALLLGYMIREYRIDLKS